MAIKIGKVTTYNNSELMGKTTELVDGFPPSTDYDPGSTFEAYNPTTKKLEKVFRLFLDGETKVWYEL